MNNNVLKIIAGILLAGAIVVAIMGIRLSQQSSGPAAVPASAAQPAAIPMEAIVVSARRIKAGQSIVASDLTMKNMATPPLQAYRVTQEVLGKTATIDIEPGTTLLPNLFVIANMANAVRPGERAMAVQVDEVIGIGGFARPGDHVDVLWFTPSNRETNDSSSAQIVIHDARLLSLGETTVMDVDTEQKSAKVEKDALDKSGVKNAQDARERRMSLRSAILAVPEAEVTHLMMAVSVGQLRLALRPVDNKTPSNVALPEPSKRMVTLNELGPAPATRKNTAAPEEAVVIQEGSKERRVAKTEKSMTP
jgi:pilus assembly protein CpaB